MHHLVDVVDRFTRDLLNAAVRGELSSGLHSELPREDRLAIVTETIVAYDRTLRRIAERRPERLDAMLTQEAFLEFAREHRPDDRRRARAPHPGPAQPEGDDAEDEGLFAGLADLAQRDPAFFRGVVDELRRGATPQQRLHVGVLVTRCTETPRPSYREIAERLPGVTEGRLRVGVLRQREKAQLLVMQRFYGVNRAALGEVELGELRAAWREDRLADLELQLDALRAVHADDPHWRLYAGLAAFRAGRLAEAELHFVRGYLLARDDAMRAKLLSNQGCVEDALGRTTGACTSWLTASSLDPRSPFPLLNLARRFVEIDASFFWSWCLTKLSKLRGDVESRREIAGFLAGCKVFEKVAGRSAWRRGPAQWIRESDRHRAGPGAGFRLSEPSRRNPARAGARRAASVMRRAA
jgi:hypothetical protein